MYFLCPGFVAAELTMDTRLVRITQLLH